MLGRSDKNPADTPGLVLDRLPVTLYRVNVGTAENRRQSYRVDLGLKITLVSARGVVFDVTAHDISRGGVKLDCAPEAADAILPLASDPLQDDEVQELTVRLTLPFITRSPELLEAHCRFVHADRKPDGGCHIGLRFTRFFGHGFETLEKYVLEQMRYR